MTASMVNEVAHRPWPLPNAPWVMFQRWEELLFMHWRAPAEQLRSRVPSPLTLEEFDGSAWVGQTPFRLEGLRVRGLPVLASRFPEMNLRTYVRVGHRPGIFFFSLDAGSRLAVMGARATYRLPYFEARMEVEREGGWIRYHSRRKSGDAGFCGRYRPAGTAYQPAPGSLEHFLVERYALYTVLRSGRILRGDIHHLPWRIQPAEVDVELNTVPAAHGIDVGDEAPLTHFAARQDTLIWPPALVGPHS